VGTPGKASKEAGLSNTVYYIIIFALFIAIFYFMGIRPQQRQRRAHQELMSTLKKGDVVMTASGIYGTIKRVEETYVVIEIAKGITMKVVRRAIADIIRDSTQARMLAPEGTSASAGRKSTRALEEASYADGETGDSDFGEDGQNGGDERADK
jgi:preprotein translocase subunit YajC